jgi:hypothetical protein
LKEEYRPRVFENRVLRKMSVPKRHEVNGERRKSCLTKSFMIGNLGQITG